jgi:large subunit ribosomal protein L17
MHRHQYKGRKFSRDMGQRKALLRSLATSVILYEKVKTTLPKAKEIRPIVEKLITTAKKGDLSAIRELNKYLLDEKAAQKLISELGPLYKDRNGGYTRIVKIQNRFGDNASMAIIELLDTEKLTRPANEEKPSTKKKEEKSAPKTKPAAKSKAKPKTKVKETK